MRLLSRCVLVIAIACIATAAYFTKKSDEGQNRQDLCLLDTTSDLSFSGVTETRPLLVHLKNICKQPLKIISVNTSCGCVSATILDSIVDPTKTADLRIAANPSIFGKIDVTIAVTYQKNGEVSHFIVPLRGWNIPEGYLDVPDRERLVFGTVLKGESVTKYAEVYGLLSTLNNISVVSESSQVAASLGPIEIPNLKNPTVGMRKITAVANLKSHSTENDLIEVSSKTGSSKKSVGKNEPV